MASRAAFAPRKAEAEGAPAPPPPSLQPPRDPPSSSPPLCASFSGGGFASPAESSFPSSTTSLSSVAPLTLAAAPAPASLGASSSSSSASFGLSTRSTFRQLLAQVEQQLASLTELSCSVRTRGFGTASCALSLEDAQETFETLRSDTFSSLDRADRLLRQLRVASAAVTSSPSSSASSVCSPAQLRHFSDLLLSLKTESHSACDAISVALERAALLHGPSESCGLAAAGAREKKSKEEEADEEGEASAAVFYAREAGSLRESNRMISSILQAGSNALYALKKQRGVVGRMRGKVSELSARDVTAISGLLGKIEWQGKKQRIILALVFAACVCLSLMWVMRGHVSAVEPGE
ncbi:hypothetical protein BESB_028800 [Besnoitia besnoiti]|uniref:Transmembrane protein n=1 Tax=Besnoitia besnoiti TaxID=94643 RepID=A0A2A9M0E3_BESBE|nr:uncharacterized protein BESB_028800 [Besnoitia besnoiti]PFH31445.1 hypothetical protein BESB_028800 [Besnoitia besnoiti]